jgi:FAD:protein FMN transferase
MALCASLYQFLCNSGESGQGSPDMYPAPRPRTSRCLRRRWAAFGSTVELRLWPRLGRVAAGGLRLAQSVRYLRRAEERLSRFRPASELSRLNRRAGEPVRVSRPLFWLIVFALAAARETDGLFDPTVHQALLAAGYDRSFESLGHERGEASSFNPQSGRFRDVILDGAHCTVTLPRDVGIDLGGIAKGWLADEVVRRLRPYGAATVDLGGDVAITEPDPHDLPWVIEVADPWTARQTLAEVSLRHSGGVATSGIVRRRWHTRYGSQHHLIDPRTGRPAVTDLASVTILAPNAVTAEVLAKAVLLLGRERGTAYLARWKQIAGILVPVTGRPIHVPASCCQPDYTLEVAP